MFARARSIRPVKTLLALAMGMGVAAGATLPEVSVTVIKPIAFESDPVRLFGEFEVRRNNFSGDLTVELVMSGTAVSADWSGVVTTTAGALSTASTVTATLASVVIPNGKDRMLIRISPVKDTDVYPAEYEEFVTARIITKRDALGNDTYVVADSNAKQISIVDGNVTAILTTLRDAAAEKFAPSVTPNYQPLSGSSLMRVWFQNSVDARAETGPATFYGAYHPNGIRNGDQSLAGRFVELTLGGTATYGSASANDYALQYKVGGSTYSIIDVDSKRVDQPWAYRLQTEDGFNTYSDVAGLNSNGTGGISTLRVASPVPRSGVYNVRITNISWDQPTPAGAAPVPAGPFSPDALWLNSINYNDEVRWQTELFTAGAVASYTTIAAAQTYANCWPVRGISADGLTLTIAPAITTANIPQGAKVNITWDTVAVVKEITGGTPAVVTTLGQVTQTPFFLETKIAEDVQYPANSVTVSVYSSETRRAYVGDVIAFSNNPAQWYRVVGPNPDIAGNPVNRDDNSAAEASVGASNVSNSFIAIWPPLTQPILRSQGVSIIAHFTPTFSGDRETVFIPSIPRPTAPFLEVPLFVETKISQYWPKGIFIDGAGGPGDLPLGDWIDFQVTPLDDAAVEGAESVTLTLNTSNANNGYEIRDPAVSTVLIRDNDAIIGVAVANNAAEPTTPGVFRVTSSKPFARDINIPFKLTTDGLVGDLANWQVDFPVAGARDFEIANLDLATGAGFITLKAGQTTADILINPIDDPNAAENTEILKIQLLDSDDYVLRTSTSSNQNASAASMELVDVIATVSVDLRDKLSVIYEGETDSAKFPAWVITATRRIGYPGNLVIPFTVTGTATNGIDILTRNGAGVLGTIGDELTITNPDTTSTIVLESKTDNIVEADETGTITLKSGTNYLVVGSLSAATVTVKDGNPSGVTTGGSSTGSGTTTSGSTSTGPGTTTGVAAGAEVEQNSGCGTGTGVALLTGLLALLGFRRRLR